MTAGVLFVPAITAVALLSRLHNRGTWMDEFWSLFLTDPALSPSELVRDRLMHDVHPPLYSLLASFARRVDDAGAYSGRVLNYAGLLLALGYTWLALGRARAEDKARRSVDSLGESHLLVFLCTTSYFLLHQLQEFRAYSLLTVASACYALSAWFVLGDSERREGADRLHRVTLVFAAFTLANSHYFGALLVLLHLTLSAALLFRAGRSGAARQLLATLLLSLLPAIAWFALTYRNFEHLSGGRFWLPELQLFGTSKTLAGVLLKACSNLVAWSLAVVGAVLLLTRARKEGRFRPTPGALATLSFALGVASLVALTLITSLHTPILMDRYLSVLTGPLCALVAVLTMQALRAAPRAWRAGLTAAVVGNGVFFCAWLVYAQDRQPDLRHWEHTAQIVGALQAKCRERPVQYAFMHSSKASPHSRDAMLAMGARRMAAQFGFTAAPAPLPNGASLTATPRCPVALWLLNVPEDAPLSADWVLARGHFTYPARPGEQLSVDHKGVTAVLHLSQKTSSAAHAHARP